jgi:hypothetical protein
MSDSFGRQLQGFGRGQGVTGGGGGRQGKSLRGKRSKTSPRRSSRRPSWREKLLQGLHGRRRRAAMRQRERLSQESLEPRLAMAITIVELPRGQDTFQSVTQLDGQLIIASDRGDNVYLKQVASNGQNLLVSDNSSFIDYQTIPNIDGRLDSVFITNGSPRADVGLKPLGSPGSDATRELSRFAIRPQDVYTLTLTLRYTQPDGNVSTWGLELRGADYYEDGITATVTLLSGPTVTESLQPGWNFPKVLTFVDGWYGDNRDGSYLDITWEDSLVSSPGLYSAVDGTTVAGTLSRVYGAITYELPGARAALDDGGMNQRSLGVIPGTLRATLTTQYGPIGFWSDSFGVLRFGDGDRAFALPAGGGNVIDIRGTITGGTVTLSTQAWQGKTNSDDGTFSFSNFLDDSPFDFLDASPSLSATYLTYTQDAVPNTVTMFAGQDFTRALTVDLLTPGSVFNNDTKLAVGADVGSRSGNQGDYDLRATTVNVNAPMAAPDRFYVGRSLSGDVPRQTTQPSFVVSPTMGLAAPRPKLVEPQAVVASDGTVEKLYVAPGLEGYGYDADNPPVVTVEPSVELPASARVSRINGAVTRVSVSNGGTGYTNGARVRFSEPENGFVQSIVVNDGGYYLSKPAVLVWGGGGSGATAEAVWDQASGAVTAVNIVRDPSGNVLRGKDYQQPPDIYIYDPRAAGQTLSAGRPARVTAVLGYEIATGTAVVEDGVVSRINILSPGSGYVAAPSITIAGFAPAAGGEPAGTGAVSSAVVFGPLVEAPIVQSGVGYPKDSSVFATVRSTVTTGNVNDVSLGRDAVVRYITDDVGGIRDDQVLSITVLDGGSGYDSNPLNRPRVTIAGVGINAEAFANVTESGRIGSITVTNAGRGYRTPPRIVIDPPRNATGRTAVAVARITEPQIVEPGSFQSIAAANASVEFPNSGTLPVIVQAEGAWDEERGVVVENAGQGYKEDEKPKIYVWGGGSNYAELPALGYYGEASVVEIIGLDGKATGSWKVDPESVSGAIADFRGRFSSAPRVFITPPRSVAAFLAKVDGLGRVNEFVRLQEGLSYYRSPIVAVSAPTEIARAEATATITAAERFDPEREVWIPAGAVTSVEVGKPGYGYLVPPRVVISPPDEGLGGVQARAVAVIDSEGRVVSINVIDLGAGYRSRPTVSIAEVNPKACVETFNADAAIQANVYELYVGDDFGTDQDRGRLLVSPTGGISAQSATFSPPTVSADPAASTLTFQGDQRALVVRGKWVSGLGIPANTRVTSVRYVSELNTTIASVTAGALTNYTIGPLTVGGGANSSYIEATKADIFVESKIEAVNQSYLLNSTMDFSQQAPFVFATRSPSTGIEVGSIVGVEVNITMGNRMPTPLLGASASSVVDLTTEIDSLRIRAGVDPDNPAGPFPYEVTIRELDDLEVAAVAASSLPITLLARGSISMPAGLSTAGDLSIVAGSSDPSAATTSFTVQSPIVSTYGQIKIEADTIGVANQLVVSAAAITDGRQDIVLNARRGSVNLGGLVSAVNDVTIRQANEGQRVGSISGTSRIRARNLTVQSEGSVSINTDVVSLVGRAETGFKVNELNDIFIPSLSSAGVVSLAAAGVDRTAPSGAVTSALLAYLNEVANLVVSTPNGSSQVYVDTQSPITLGDPAAVANAAQAMQSAGSVLIRSNGSDITVLDAPVAGTGARYVRVATTQPLSVSSGRPVTYSPGNPGTVAATLSGDGLLPLIDGVTLRVGDRVLVKDQANDLRTVGINEKRENGIYEVTRVGGGVLGAARWVLTRSADADTSADLPTNSYVRVGDGTVNVRTFFRVDYVVVPVTLVERTTANQIQLPADFDRNLVVNLVAGQVVTGTGIAPGARIAADGVSPTADGRTIVRLERVSADVESQPDQSRIKVKSSFSAYNNLFVGQRVFGEGVLPDTVVTKIDPVTRQISVSPEGLPYSRVLKADEVATASTTPSFLHTEFFDEYIVLPESFNDFASIRVGQRVIGSGLQVQVREGKEVGVIVTGIDPASRMIGFARGSITAAEVRGIAFQGLSRVSFGMIQGTGAGYAEFAMQPLGMARINVVPVPNASFTTNIGSDREGTSVNLVVSTAGIDNASPGSLGKMISLRQTNLSARDMTFRFGNLAAPIRLDQALPPIAKPFAIVGNSSVVIDGSRITRDAAGNTLGERDTVNGFDFQQTSGGVGPLLGASVSNVTLGGFTRGAAIAVGNARDILVDGVILGRGRLTNGAVTPNSNAVGISVTGANGSATITNSQIYSSKQYRTTSSGDLLAGQGVKTSAGGAVTVVGTTIGGVNETNYMGVELAGVGASRIGVDGSATPRVQGTTTAGTNRLQLPAGMSADMVHVGQPVVGAGIPAGTVVRVINRGANATWLRLSNPMTRTGSSAISFATPARNAIQYSSGHGVRIIDGRSAITNSDIRFNVGDAVRIEGGVNRVGTNTTLRDSSNAIYANTGLAVNVRKLNTPTTTTPTLGKTILQDQIIQGNYFGSILKATSGTANGRGDVGTDDFELSFDATWGFNPPVPSTALIVKDKWGNQYLGASTATGPTPPTPNPTPKPTTSPTQPWNAQ